MRTLIWIIAFFLVICIVILFFPQTNFNDKSKIVYIKGGNFYTITKQLEKENIISYPFLFKATYKFFFKNYPIQSGRYEIGRFTTNLVLILKLIKGGNSEVKLILTKVRTKTEFVHLFSQKLNINTIEFMNFINNDDSLLPYQVNANDFLTLIIPNTYYFYWNSSIDQILKKFYNYQQEIKNSIEMNPDFIEKKMSYKELYILASIVEEESNSAEDKKLIASTYLNRIKIGMPLQADPTVKYAQQNFSLNRILHKHLKIKSPYNTYLHRGLPPGPICTPSIETLYSVIEAPSTNYLYFVSQPNFSGQHIFSSNFKDHSKYVKNYHIFLNKLKKTTK